jgi:hypothetical protein
MVLVLACHLVLSSILLATDLYWSFSNVFLRLASTQGSGQLPGVSK